MLTDTFPPLPRSVQALGQKTFSLNDPMLIFMSAPPKDGMPTLPEDWLWCMQCSEPANSLVEDSRKMLICTNCSQTDKCPICLDDMQKGTTDFCVVCKRQAHKDCLENNSPSSTCNALMCRTWFTRWPREKNALTHCVSKKCPNAPSMQCQCCLRVACATHARIIKTAGCHSKNNTKLSGPAGGK